MTDKDSILLCIAVLGGTGKEGSALAMRWALNGYKVVIGSRDAEKAIGKVDYNLTDKQKKGKDFSRSLYIVEDVAEGEVLTEKNVRSIRPGFGLHPKYYQEVLGKKVKKDIERGERLKIEDLE